jgi:hypothetical protein
VFQLMLEAGDQVDVMTPSQQCSKPPHMACGLCSNVFLFRL